MNKKYYWTMKNGQQIDVDQMDENHLRNALKMVIRQSETRNVKKTIGNIEQNFIEDSIREMEDDEYYYLYGI